MNELKSIRATVTQSPAHRVQRLARVLCLILSAIPLCVHASSPGPALRAQALQMAGTVPWAGAKTAVAHPLGVQTLSVERQENKADRHTPLIRVYQFHYDLRQARLIVVDTAREHIVEALPVRSVHLPLNATEVKYSQSLLSQRADVVRQLRDEQQRRGHAAFTHLTELQIKASVYEPLNSAHVCHVQRCALLSLFDRTRTVFAVEPIVNLQSQQVELLELP